MTLEQFAALQEVLTRIADALEHANALAEYEMGGEEPSEESSHATLD
ncbi:hypothetical protein [Neisseria weixii]|nr:hypothetical protein [Neisseria weixii]